MSQDTKSGPQRRSWPRLAITLVALFALIVPMAAWASHRFTDVPDSNVFHEDISWLADSGVTLGCNPPDNTLYCPSDYVTREQMSAFLRRLAENEVVDAATANTADTADHAAHADHADTADDADTVDGKHADELGAYLTGSTRDGVTGAPPVNIPVNNFREILTIELDAENGQYAVLDYRTYMIQPNLNPAVGVMWIQVDDNQCDLQTPNYLEGSLVFTASLFEPFADGSGSVAAGVSDTTAFSLCSAAQAFNQRVAQANLNAVQSHQGSSTIAAVTSGPVSDSADPDDPLGLVEMLESVESAK